MAFFLALPLSGYIHISKIMSTSFVIGLYVIPLFSGIYFWHFWLFWHFGHFGILAFLAFLASVCLSSHMLRSKMVSLFMRIHVPHPERLPLSISLS